MPEQLDQVSQQVAEQMHTAGSALSEAERIFDEETTGEHRERWSNVYRLEAATKHAQAVLALIDPRVTPESAANELVASSEQARDAIRAAVDSGGGDLIGSANRLLSVTSQIQLGMTAWLDERREEIERSKRQIKTQIGEAAAEVTGQKDQAFTAINEAVEAIDVRRQAADQQASELGLVTSAIAAENLANTYATEAKKTEVQARRYTWGSLLIGVISVGVTVLGLVTAKEDSSLQAYLGHAAIGIPVALLAAYVNSLASTHRHEAWRLRHIELQIRTANPFLGLLDSGRREETLAALALRFFPGQEGVSFDGQGAGVPAPELIELLRAALPRRGGNSTASQAAGTSTVQTSDSPA